MFGTPVGAAGMEVVRIGIGITVDVLLLVLMFVDLDASSVVVTAVFGTAVMRMVACRLPIFSGADVMLV